MRDLSIHECHQTAGAMDVAMGLKLVTSAVAAIGGGVLSYKGMDYLGPFSTVIGTVGLGATFGGIGTVFGGPVGGVLCAAAGGALGYLVSSTFANVGAFGIGATASGVGSLYLLGAI